MYFVKDSSKIFGAFSFPSAHVHKYKWVYWYRPKSMLFKYWLWVSANSFFYRTTGKFVQKKLFLRISQQSANSLQIPRRLWLWNQMTFPVSLLYSLLRPMSVWHQTEQRWLVFGSDDVYSENGLDFSAAVFKRIICGLSKYGSMTRHMSASILPLNSFMAERTIVDVFLKPASICKVNHYIILFHCYMSFVCP